MATADPTGPPPALVRALVDGPGVLSGLDWHPQVESTNKLAADAARRGVPEVHAVLADVQTVGRGRQGRVWQAPAGTSLLMSLMLRPAVPPAQLSLLPLLVGVVLVDVAGSHLRAGTDPGGRPEAAKPPEAGGSPQAGLKWPNDLLLRRSPDAGWQKAAGVLVDAVGSPPEAVVVGIGFNVDWRDVDRPAELAHASSLAETTGQAVDRWKLFAGFVGVFGQHYHRWREQPDMFLEAYRRCCVTIGEPVRVTRTSGPPLVGLAVGVGDDGALEVRVSGGVERVSAGDVDHLRPHG